MDGQQRQAEAWRAFINTGVIDEEVVRPEIARSWLRCRAAGVNPWSSDFPSMDAALLEEKRSRYAHSSRANIPVMKMLMTLLNCNVSLMDQENFVFEFFSPLDFYPRTFGTFVLEEQVGTGNATIVPYEKKPVRCDGFEQYRAVSQAYSGVSAPFLDEDGVYYGALNFNDPMRRLPDYALDMCALGVDLANDLFCAGRGMWAKLSTAEFFSPLIRLMDAPVLLTDRAGRILIANEPMRSYLPKYETFSYGTQSLSAYLSGRNPLESVLAMVPKGGMSEEVVFKAPRRKEEKVLMLARRHNIELQNGMSFMVFVFDRPEERKSEPTVGRMSIAKKGQSGAQYDRTIDYIGEHEEWRKVDALVRKVAPVRANVLILGETGSGKEVVARALHRLSGRKGNFVAINCGAIPRDLFAAELFGYERGAFTGARESGAPGKIEAADGGTLFLDEIGEMPMDLQVSLLRVIQEQQVMRLGSNEPRNLDVRFLAATNQDVQRMIDARTFRADLYYRLSMVEVRLPSLRQRSSDIPLLAEFFNEHLSETLGLPYSPFSDDVMSAFVSYSWPGNVRELRNIVERSLIMGGEGAAVSRDDLPAHVANAVYRSGRERFVPAQQFAGFPDGAAAHPGQPGGYAPGGAGRSGSFVPAGFGQPGGFAPATATRMEELEDAGGSFGASAGFPPGSVMYAPAEESPDDRERSRIAELIEAHGGNISQVAKELGVSRNTLYRRMEQLHLRVKVSVEVDK